MLRTLGLYGAAAVSLILTLVVLQPYRFVVGILELSLVFGVGGATGSFLEMLVNKQRTKRSLNAQHDSKARLELHQ